MFKWLAKALHSYMLSHGPFLHDIFLPLGRQAVIHLRRPRTRTNTESEFDTARAKGNRRAIRHVLEIRDDVIPKLVDRTSRWPPISGKGRSSIIA
jgi:hypothetical protein